MRDTAGRYQFESATPQSTSSSSTPTASCSTPPGSTTGTEARSTTPTGSYTILNFPVEDLERVVDGLQGSGVVFERYEGFDQDDEGIARGTEGPAIAWFTDPAGNILSVHEQT